MEKQKSIFKKSSESTINIGDLMKTIPPNTMPHEDPELMKTMIEWRWRFFNINGHHFVEISKKKPEDKRLYVNSNGDMIEKEIDDIWNQYIEKEKYYYTE